MTDGATGVLTPDDVAHIERVSIDGHTYVRLFDIITLLDESSRTYDHDGQKECTNALNSLIAGLNELR